MAHKSFIAVNLFMKSATYLNVYLRQRYVYAHYLVCTIVGYCRVPTHILSRLGRYII